MILDPKSDDTMRFTESKSENPVFYSIMQCVRTMWISGVHEKVVRTVLQIWKSEKSKERKMKFQKFEKIKLGKYDI